MYKKSPLAIVILLLVGCGLACSVLRPKRPLTWHLTLELDSPAADRDAAVKQTIEVLEKRLDAVGVSNFEIKPQSDGRLRLNLPEVADRGRLQRFITAGGRLEITPVISSLSPAPLQTYGSREEAAAVVAAGKTGRVTPYESTNQVGTASRFVILEETPIVTGKDLRLATAIPAKGNDNYSIAFSLRANGADRLGAWTGDHINSYIAIVLNGTVVSAAYIKSQILDQGVIDGNFTKAQAEDLAQILKSGALPAPIKIVEEGVDIGQ